MIVPRFGMGAVSALALLLSACGNGFQDDNVPDLEPQIARANDALAAEVDGSPIYFSDVRREAIALGQIEADEDLSVDSVIFTQVLEELIDQRLLALEAIRRDLHRDEEARRRLATARERIMGNVLVEKVVDRAITDDAVRRMYDEQVSLVELGDEVRARHIVVAEKNNADALLRRLAQGADFAELAGEHSIDTITAEQGGDLGYFTPDVVPASLSRAVFAAAPGDLVGPVETELGWHVLLIEDRRPEPRPSFEELKPRLVQFMTFDEIQRMIDVLRARSEVRRYNQASMVPIIPATNEEDAPDVILDDPEDAEATPQ